MCSKENAWNTWDVRGRYCFPFFCHCRCALYLVHRAWEQKIYYWCRWLTVLISSYQPRCPPTITHCPLSAMGRPASCLAHAMGYVVPQDPTLALLLDYCTVGSACRWIQLSGVSNELFLVSNTACSSDLDVSTFQRGEGCGGTWVSVRTHKPSASVLAPLGVFDIWGHSRWGLARPRRCAVGVDF